MGYTPTLHLYLPALGEQGYGTHLNENFEAIDTAIGEMQAAVDPTSYVPTGCQVIGYSATPANGWLLCDGSEVSRTTYAKLFAAIGTTYGTPSDPTKFKLPNKVGRVVVGADPASANPDYLLGKTGGAEKVTLTANQMPKHDHSGATDSDGGHKHTASTTSTGNHSHSYFKASENSWVPDYGNGPNTPYVGGNSTTGKAGNHSHDVTVDSVTDHTHGIGEAGNNEAHENRMPYIAEYWWIKT